MHGRGSREAVSSHRASQRHGPSTHQRSMDASHVCTVANVPKVHVSDTRCPTGIQAGKGQAMTPTASGLRGGVLVEATDLERWSLELGLRTLDLVVMVEERWW